MGVTVYFLGAVIVALLGVWQSESFLYTSHECVANDGPFSCTYEEARDKFRAAITPFLRDANDMQSYPVSDEGLEIDIAYIGSKAPTGLVIHMSGTHGVEAHAGAGVQTDWLRKLSEGTGGKEVTEFIQPDRNVGIVFVSLLNPYGMKYGRRFNENSVDLNRNLLTDKQWESLKKSGGNAKKEYEQFDVPLFNPPRPAVWSDSWLTLPKALYYTVIYGVNTLKTAVVTGQYYNPKGIFYTGDKIQPSYQAVTDYFQNRSELFSNVRTTMIVDVHTGLGPAGIDTLMPDSDAVCNYFPGAPVCDSHASEATTEVAAGYELVWGTTSKLITALPLGIPGSHMHVCQEFGTVPGIMVVNALVLENMAYHYGTSGVSRETFQQGLRDAFYVRNDAWEELVRARGALVLEQAIVGVSKA
ncbi:hypothetical protein SARC_00491 [Sphaeroforma arctica JP610]|uniref:Peptidase M14 carboxypeptidase A domain-containing protein n=1 Tax=Sphaeroforma arctica JP610 TaxID=667725 RepID=A0A0L0GEF9_9EUKA|nr:hypothetical protein SARC_00491 [Sphaeroforma arctica JP610]KNC87400.1 hypothetical protein SARC_00491 [Sphaeroforma arctica JP610]|eukprot:XP_014161302.1 hypothetical protein SARC_00491 [Sphaeroforma arctica JP610]